MPSMFRRPYDVSTSTSSVSDSESSDGHVSGAPSPSGIRSPPHRGPRSPPVPIPDRRPRPPPQSQIPSRLPPPLHDVRNYGILNDGPPPSRPKAITRLTSALNMSSLQPHQRQGLLQLAFLEQRCRETAWMVLNKDRGPHNQFSRDDPVVEAEAQRTYSELVPGFAQSLNLPEELTGPGGKQLRQSTLNGLDSILISSTSARVNSLDSPAVPVPQLTNNSVLEGSPVSDYSLPTEPHLLSNSFKHVALGSGGPFGGMSSPYRSEHQELCMLGKGGYGQVWKVKNFLDNQCYAVKKIVISSQRLEKYSQNDQVEALLEELRTLAKLHHTNVVRYYHGWIERTDPSRPATGDKSLLEGPSSTDGFTGEESDDLIVSEYSGPGLNDLDGPQHQLGFNEMDEDDGGIIFGEDSSSAGHSAKFTVDRDRASRGTSSSTRTFTKASLLSVGEDDEGSDVENIARSLPRSQPNIERQMSLAHMPFTKSEAPKAQERGSFHGDAFQGPDITLFIKMSLHPTTLSNFLSPDPPREDESVKRRHCFHRAPSVGMLSAILDGIEYLHSQRIVHRDLKPANIFLSVDTDRPPATSGFVDVIECPQCTHETGKHVYLTPCIGDFGLIAEMKDTTPATTSPFFHQKSERPASSSSEPSFEPSPLAQIRQQQRPVGTQFYRPTQMPSEEPRICPKLDIYSLGVIAFELLYKFGTRTERALVLNGLGKGKLPKDFDQKMALGIRSMVCEDRDTRWGCKEVREWLKSF